MAVALAESPLPAGPAAVEEIEVGHSLWQDAWARLRKNRLAVVSGIVLIVVSLLCVVGPLFAPPPDAQDLALYATPPSMSHCSAPTHSAGICWPAC